MGSDTFYKLGFSSGLSPPDLHSVFTGFGFMWSVLGVSSRVQGLAVELSLTAASLLNVFVA